MRDVFDAVAKEIVWWVYDEPPFKPEQE